MTLQVRAVLMTCKHAMECKYVMKHYTHLKSATTHCMRNLNICATAYVSGNACHTATWSLMLDMKHITCGKGCMRCKGMRHSLGMAGRLVAALRPQSALQVLYQSALHKAQKLCAPLQMTKILVNMHQGQQPYLTTSTFAIFCTFNDSWQIQHLDLGSSVVHHSRNACQGCELICCHLSDTSNGCQVLRCRFIVSHGQVDTAGTDHGKLHLLNC